MMDIQGLFWACCQESLQNLYGDDLVRGGRDRDDVFSRLDGVAVNGRFIEFDGLDGDRLLPEADAFGESLARGIPEAENLSVAVFCRFESGEDELVVQHFHKGLLR